MIKYYFNWNTDKWTTSPVDVAYRTPHKQTLQNTSTTTISAAEKAHGFQGALKSVLSVFHKHSPEENAQDVTHPKNVNTASEIKNANEYVM